MKRLHVLVPLVLLLVALPLAAWATTFTDNFNRANSTELGASWDPETGLALQIVGNRVRGQTVASGQEEIATQALSSDQFARVTIATFTSGAVYGDARAFVRAANPATARQYYACLAYKNDAGGLTSEIVLRTSGVVSLASESATPWAAGDKLECRAIGSTISLWRTPSGGSAAQLLSATNSSLATGRVGMGLRDDGALANVELDDFDSGDFAGAGSVLVASPTGADAAGTPCTDAQPCSVHRAVLTINCANNEIIELLNGVYRGDNYMILPGLWAPGKSGTDNAHRCTIRARNEGQVFIDGQFQRATHYINGNNYWSFIGYDVGNAGPPNQVDPNLFPPDPQNSVIDTAWLANNHHLEFKRICASNVAYPPWNNTHVWAVNSVRDSLFEDICGFGVGRNTLIEFDTQSGNNTYRRVWMRWEGYYSLPPTFASAPGGCGGGTIQTGYHTQGTSTFENVIAIWDGQQMAADPVGWGGIQHCANLPGEEPRDSVGARGPARVVNNRDEPGDNTPGRGDKWRGLITFGRTPEADLAEYQALNYVWLHNKSSTVAFDTHIDAFVDARSQRVPPYASSCGGVCADRMTALRSSLNPTSICGSSGSVSGTRFEYCTPSTIANNLFAPGTATNFNECTDINACPNFYTGLVGGTQGARNCFEYQDSVLTGAPLWPWRMDDRIKAALARANAAGTGGSPLAGIAGTGYAAGTVTSEIVARYGAIPPACNRTVVPSSGERFAAPTSAGANDAGATCTSALSPCTVRRALVLVQPGETVTLLDGTYRGANDMLDLAVHVPGKAGAAGSPITVRAQNDGGAFIDGQFTNKTLRMIGHAYWTFQGFDAGNSDASVFESYNPNSSAPTHHITVKRVCFSNVRIPNPIDRNRNEHIIGWNTINDSLFEDVCVFGSGGRTGMTDYSGDGVNNYNNTWRRVWVRWEGMYPTNNNPVDGVSFCAPTPAIQFGYYTKGPMTYENIITVHDPEQYNLATWGNWNGCTIGVPYVPGIAPARSIWDWTYPGGAYTFRGIISYGYDGFTAYAQNHIRTFGSGDSFAQANAGPMTWRDYFVDARSQDNGDTFTIYCDTATYPGCGNFGGSFADRLTNLRVSNSTPASFLTVGSSAPTNANDCVATAGATGASIGGCPSFYTGDTPGTGARNCFEYANGVLTSTKLWPWRMDDRIKAALARAHAAGTGGSALAGTAGTGYAANTVTSEIVSRYGALPAACDRGAAPAVTERFAAPTSQGADNAGATCGSSLAPCTVRRALVLAAAGETVTLLNGTYQGANDMLNLASHVPGKSGSAGSPITVRAQNDGGAFIDGQMARAPLVLDGHSYWTFRGFDVGNSSSSVVGTGSSGGTNLTFQRICASNASTASSNEHVWLIWNVSNSLFEDVCAFGTGRNSFGPFDPNTANVTVRRAWFRFDGWHGTGGPVMPVQSAYGTAQTELYENVITVWGVNQDAGPPGPPGASAGGSGLQRDPTPGGAGNRYRGWIGYGTQAATYAMDLAWFHSGQDATGTSIVDMFIDGRAQNAGFGPIYLGAGGTADRLTALRLTTTSTFGWTTTNANECTTPGACPNFYTGTPGTGARNCFEYTDGVLGTSRATQALWPWRMDDRIKAALARAGATPLTGSAGTGYAAGTVTSEIVSRYGAVPDACNRTAGSGVFTPNFPIVTDFPSTPVLDTFNRPNGALGSNWIATVAPPFTIIANQAVAPPGAFARMEWTGGTVGAFHEVYKKVVLANPCCTLLSFAGTPGTENSQWRLFADTPTGSNTSLSVRRIDSGGGATIIMGPIDLGTAVTEPNQSFGVRVAPNKIISVYWRYTDGHWYQVGTVIDSSLPSGSGNAIGFAGAAPETDEDFGGGTCCTGPIVPPSPPNAGRFGTTFPKP